MLWVPGVDTYIMRQTTGSLFSDNFDETLFCVRIIVGFLKRTSTYGFESKKKKNCQRALFHIIALTWLISLWTNKFRRTAICQVVRTAFIWSAIFVTFRFDPSLQQCFMQISLFACPSYAAFIIQVNSNLSVFGRHFRMLVHFPRNQWT